MPDSCWTIAPLFLATAEADRSLGLLYRGMGQPTESAVLAFLLINGSRKILVDSGVCGYIRSAQCERYFKQTAEQTLPAQLARFDTEPGEIGTVINTHLHIDHCSGNELFETARFVVQRSELLYWRNSLRVHRQAYAVAVDEARVEAVDGDFDVAAGVRVLLTPGHSPGSQSVLVQTKCGPYVLAGDTVPHFANMAVAEGEPFWPSGIYTDLFAYYESLNRLKNLGVPILPGHDPKVLDREIYP